MSYPYCPNCGKVMHRFDYADNWYGAGSGWYCPRCDTRPSGDAP